ncbi:MAG: 3-oxo-5-alpha-steroid 4-dehydrogenase [Alphaproteobacteria bacterium]|nr:3-oxo-5-alpha-steroid 4-dehydrogenase [Alphaproteobacteria bacterium]
MEALTMSPLDPYWHQATVTALLVLALPVFAILWWLPAPYGRHGDPRFGPMIPGRIAWFLMECPTLLVFVPVLAMGEHATEPVVLVLAALWLLHYVNRTLVYPMRLPSVRPMATAAVVSGFAFQMLNSSANAAALGQLTDWSGWATDPRFAIGCALFLVGQAVHHHGDGVLMGLRKPGETGYKVPEAGLYRWVTNVAYLGEITSWTGWALATGTLAGLAMLVFTLANLVPRAASHHRWYRETFPDYPSDRRILVPFVW